nr:unnamed protein product [Callosobruchus chinensis]
MTLPTRPIALAAAAVAAHLTRKIALAAKGIGTARLIFGERWRCVATATKYARDLLITRYMATVSVKSVSRSLVRKVPFEH